MATTKYFSGETELSYIFGMKNAEFASRFPEVKGRRFDSFKMMVGSFGGHKTTLPVERVITYKSNPSEHECDARCLNAKGRTMQCECSCGGKNHGKGSLSCS